MTVRAKFNVTRYETQVYTKSVKQEDGTYKTEKQEMRTIIMHPVYSNNEHDENRTFWDATPSGEIRLGTVNPAAWQAFEIDKTYYVDFSPAD